MQETKEEPEKDTFKTEIKSIGVINTPYKLGRFVPYQPLEREQGEARIKLFSRYIEALHSLEKFNYIYVLYYMEKNVSSWTGKVKPPWAKGHSVGLFASRSPNRPNRMGLSIVKLKKIEGDTLITSSMDVYDDTPLIDLKPYIKELDSKHDANYGWLEDVDGYEHLMLHMRGIPHEDT